MKYKRIGPKYTCLETLSIDEFVLLCSSMNKVSSRKQQWLSLIEANKLTCVITGEKVYEVRKDISFSNHGAIHYNFYTKDGDMMTIDHIIPKSKGGSKMNVDNLQPMINYFNNMKGSSSMKQFRKSLNR